MMKRFKFLLVTAALATCAFAFTACGTTNNDRNNGPTGGTEAPYEDNTRNYNNNNYDNNGRNGMGDDIRDGVNDIGDAIDDAGNAIRDGVRDVTDTDGNRTDGNNGNGR